MPKTPKMPLNDRVENAELEHALEVDVDKTPPAPIFSASLDRAMMLRLDALLVPMMCALYLLAFLDRANIGNARVAGLQKDLSITDHQYQTAITVTYVPYIVAELPSNLLLKKIGPRILMPTLCLVWGLVTTLQSQVSTYSGLIACRFFLGLAEGGLFPGIVLYLSGFYRPHELQVRVALFFSAAALSSAFSGLLAAAIQQMEGIRGMHGWQWIFLLEGAFTVAFSLFAFWILPNDASQVKTFTPEQAKYCLRRLELDPKGFENQNISGRALLSTFKDLHIWLPCLALFCNGCSLFGLAYFTPSIVQGFGYTPTKTQLYTVPPFAIAFVFTMIAAFIADRYKARGVVAISTSLIAIIGFAVFLTAETLGVRYTALCFLVTGIYSTAPSLISWIPNNAAAHTRRATAVAIAFIATNTGGIVSTWIYPRSTAPEYRFAAKFNLALTVIATVLLGMQVILLIQKNARKLKQRDRLLAGVQEMDFYEQFEALGDHHPDFKYTL